jgi:hypothetical protein
MKSPTKAVTVRNSPAHWGYWAKKAKGGSGADELDVVADRGSFNSTEILACHEADIAVTLPKPSTSSAKSDGHFGQRGLSLHCG